MNREDIIRMAREAGFRVGPSRDGPDEVRGAGINLEWFAALVAKHTLANIDPSSFMSWQEGYAAGATAEREACAYRAGIALLGADRGLANRVDQAIRARGQNL